MHDYSIVVAHNKSDKMLPFISERENESPC